MVVMPGASVPCKRSRKEGRVRRLTIFFGIVTSTGFSGRPRMVTISRVRYER
jgi:hypothetical protein